MRIAENVYLVGRGNWGQCKALSRGHSCNVYVIDGGSELALVDAGMPESCEDILANIRNEGLDTDRLRKVLLTHAHWDHTAGLANFAERLPLTAFGHALCRETMGDGPGIYEGGFRAPVHFPATVHEILKKGSAVQVGNIRVDVVELPGHTPDGLGFLIDSKDGRLCFSGDTAIGNQGEARGVIGWIDGHWKSCLADHQSSLELLKSLKLAGLFAGHGEPILGLSSVEQSLTDCLWRLNLLRSIPHLGTMMHVY